MGLEEGRPEIRQQTFFMRLKASDGTGLQTSDGTGLMASDGTRLETSDWDWIEGI